jgi:magnesium transporter
MQFELTKEYLNSVKVAIVKADEHALIELLEELHAADISEVIDRLTVDEAKMVLQCVDVGTASEAITHLDEEDRESILEAYSSEEIADQFIENLETDDAADIIQELPDHKKEEVIAHIDDVDQAGQIVDLLNFEEGTAGSIMGKELVKVYENISITDSVTELRRQAEEITNVYTIYVVDEKERLKGRLSLKKLLTAPMSSRIKDIYQSDIRKVKTTDPVEEIASIMEKYDLVALPVVDEIGRLAGRITIDDVVDVIKDEAKEDYQLASGISEDVESTDSIWLLTRARLPWLLLGLLGGIFGARVISIYEGDIQLYPEMAFFIPLVAAMGGNVGVQSSAIVVQGLANKTMGFGGIVHKLTKEFGVALLNGIVCAILVLVYNIVFSDSLNLSYTVSLSLLVVIIYAALFGTFVPLVLDKYKIDPALATGPFITTVNDILGLFIYFLIGRAMYGM